MSDSVNRSIAVGWLYTSLVFCGLWRDSSPSASGGNRPAKLKRSEMKRRDFLTLTAATLATSALALPTLAESGKLRPLKILILGGTGFIGPHQVEAALGRGHEVTIFNRGKTAPGLFPQIEELLGDRSNDLEALKDREWDAVLDNSGFLPSWVKMSADLLSGHVGQYLYMSSISIYADNTVIGQTENGRLHQLSDPRTEDTKGQNYGGMKALSEEHVNAAFPKTATIARVGLVVGPGDPTDRFTYWPVRVHRGGEVLAPGTAKDPIQCIDVRDLARWMIKSVERQHYGVYNITGPYQQLTMGNFLETVRTTTNADATFTWVPAEFLEKHKVNPWTDLPLWVPPNSGMEGFVQIDITKAINADLTFRPMATTVQDSLAWYRTLDEGAPLKAGLSADEETELLTAWHKLARSIHKGGDCAFMY